jgi:hypothetical protein
MSIPGATTVPSTWLSQAHCQTDSVFMMPTESESTTTTTTTSGLEYTPPTTTTTSTTVTQPLLGSCQSNMVDNTSVSTQQSRVSVKRKRGLDSMSSRTLVRSDSKSDASSPNNVDRSAILAQLMQASTTKLAKTSSIFVGRILESKERFRVIDKDGNQVADPLDESRTDVATGWLNMKAARAATNSMDTDRYKARYFEYRLVRMLRLLVVERSCPAAASWIQSICSERGLDGWMCGVDTVSIINASTCMKLLDDDKQPGLTQSFLTDMFANMSLNK